MANLYPELNRLTSPASARRAPLKEVVAIRQRLLLDRVLSSLIEALPDYVLVLNQERQVVAVNSRLLQGFGFTDITTLLGKRIGEVFGCINADEGPDGCGTGIHCSVCGALMAILESQERNTQSCHECRITLKRDGGVALDLEVIANPATIDRIPLTLCIIRDISDQKRRSVLERVFFHDVINTAGGIHGLASLLADGRTIPPDKEAEYKGWMVHLSSRLIDEINHQRKLLAAEQGTFKPDLGLVEVGKLLQEVQALYSAHDIAAGRQLLLRESPSCSIISDGQILRRILGNLVKNALEATPAGGTVTLSATDDGDTLTFTVANPGVISPDVQLQIFQRSFTTKGGSGRGIGTYSVKLFGERYLKGKVAFSSCDPEGTVFTVTIPKQLH
ncbi:sensor histidine kinase [Geotalea uraniireducens]|uniref:Sensor histidine kinase n=1 Tax=Geotalea uraniireducens TaxID=351604 RepID=A0ABM8EKS6_9BACT|nr:PAS domain-containing sensor histidine kinase [Geotalea uraniireducens]BDV42609.1 sensor histidine kinase [Geotalea uraniireducens]